MNLKEHIRKVLKEETQVPIQVLRRHHLIDEMFEHMRSRYHRLFCDYRNPNILLGVLYERTLSDLYHAWFYQTVSDDDWDYASEYIQKYLKDKYEKSTIMYWENECKRRSYLYETELKEMMDISDMNILNKPLQICGEDPMTGYYRDGYCKTDSSDKGTHTVCSEVDDEFLEFTKSKGNDLSFLKSGDRWCLCANRWKEAHKVGKAPKVIKNATNKKTLDVIGGIKDDELSEYARTLKNARRQGSGLRFPKSAIKANPLRFRPYNR
jgi:uncharacterized protein (DUF2237 family)